MNRTQLLIIGVVGLGVLVFFLMLLGILPGFKSSNQQNTEVKLAVWGIGRQQDFFSVVQNDMRTQFPNLSIEYKEFPDKSSYDYAITEAISTGKSPDIFMIANEDMPRFKNKTAPIPSTTFSLLQMQQLFPETVWKYDFSDQNGIYAIPLSIDTLALYYNRDLLSAASIPVPPNTWEGVEEVVPSLTKKSATGTIEQSAIALGGTEQTVAHASDILSSLMIRAGSKMVSPDFKEALIANSESKNALTFYTKFADEKSPLYTWNETMPYSLDAFAGEKVAMILGYLRDENSIREKNPSLNFGIAPIPQPKNAQKPLTYPSYYGYAVSRTSTKKEFAWPTLVKFTTDPTIATQFSSEKIKVVPALLSLINDALTDIDLSVFAKQALTARSWAQVDAPGIRTIFSGTINSVLTGALKPEDALKDAQVEINKLFARKVL